MKGRKTAKKALNPLMKIVITQRPNLTNQMKCQNTQRSLIKIRKMSQNLPKDTMTNTMKNLKTQKNSKKKRKTVEKNHQFSISINLSRNQKKSHLQRKSHPKYKKEESAGEVRGKCVRSQYLRCQFKKSNTKNTRKKKNCARENPHQRESDRVDPLQRSLKEKNHQSSSLSLILTWTPLT